jgi:hypothetical protein
MAEGSYEGSSMDYETILLALGSALAGNCMGGLMSMFGVLLTYLLHRRSEIRKEERQRLIDRVEGMRRYLSQGVAIAAQSRTLQELERNLPAEGTRSLMKLWYEDMYPLRTLFYEEPELRDKLRQFDRELLIILAKREDVGGLQRMAADISSELDTILEQRSK